MKDLTKRRTGREAFPVKSSQGMIRRQKNHYLKAQISVFVKKSCTALISDLILTAEELGSIKRMHWSIENRLHHVLDDTFREDRSPAKKSRNNLSLIRKFAYNILRLAMYETGLTNIMTEMMDCFCDNATLREQYVFQGIASLY